LTDCPLNLHAIGKKYLTKYKERVMKSHLWIVLLTGIYPYQAQALITSALDTASDITSDVVHSVSDTAGDATDVALDATVGTVERVIEPRRRGRVVLVAADEEEDEAFTEQD
jgi:hypothetical protein